MKLGPAESLAPFQPPRVEPKLGLMILAFHVDVRRLIPVTGVEEKPVRADSQYGWHRFTLPTLFLMAARTPNTNRCVRSLQRPWLTRFHASLIPPATVYPDTPPRANRTAGWCWLRRS